MSFRVIRSSLALALLAISLVAVPAEAAADEDEGCRTVTELGRHNSAVHWEKTQDTCAVLHEELDHDRRGKKTHREELGTILEDRELGHLTEKLWSAIATCDSVEEITIAKGDKLDWMTFRKNKKLTTFGPVCFDTEKDYPAFEITVTENVEDTGEPPAKADCSLKATGGACVGDPIHLETSAGATVEMTGAATNTFAGNTGYDYEPTSAGTYSFVAAAQGKTPEARMTAKNHKFVIPKVCMNLAYDGYTPVETQDKPDSCQQTASVTVEDCKPWCEIQVNPTQVRRKESVTVEVTGEWDDGGISVEVTDPKSNSLATLTDFPATVTPKKKGVYNLSGTATNSAGSATCSAQFTVGKVMESVDSRWTARFFGLKPYVDDDTISESLVRPDGVSERSHLKLDNGDVGAGAGLEYHINSRIGIEGSVLYAPIEAEFMFDLDDAWETAEDDVDMLAFLIGPNFHLTPDKKVDVYIGPFIGLVDLGDVSFRVLGETQRRSLDADTAFGAQLGVDIPFGKGKWAVHTGVRYMDLSVEVMEEGPEIAADPFIVELGFAYKF